MRDDYFDWLYDIVCDSDKYKTLCAYLHGQEFTYTIPMDGNRYEDGISLRYRYGYECDIPNHRITDELDNRPCSVFEMMVALALRMEEDIMACPGEDRTAEWFEEMLGALGLHDMSNERFNEHEASRVTHNFLNRDYAKNGQGGLFIVDNMAYRDLRTVEIWYQAIWFLNEVLKGEGTW